MKTLICSVLCATALLTTPAVAQDKPAADTNMQILRDKIKADKRLLVAENMRLTESEAKPFWPIYDAYQKDLQQIDERLGKAIDEYANAYKSDTLTDGQAKKIINEAIAIEGSEAKLRETYAEKLARVLPGKKVARYLQIESKIRALVRFELASRIPLVE